MRFWIVILLIALPSFGAQPSVETQSVVTSDAPTLVAERRRPRRKRRSRRAKRRPAEAQTAYEMPTTRNPKMVLSTGFGAQVLDKPGLISLAQFRFSLTDSRRIYGGLDASYTLFAPGTLFMASLGGWYEVRLFGNPRLSWLVGGLAGAGFADGLSAVSGTTPVLFLDSAIMQEVDDLVSVRAQFRPGLVGSRFTFVMSFQFSFRFT